MSLPSLHLESKGTLIEKKLAASIMADPDIQALVRAHRVSTPQFRETVLAKTIEIIKADPAIRGDFARKMFASDRFGRTLSQQEQDALLTFILNRPELIKASGGEPSLRNKTMIMEAARYELKEIYAKWEIFKARNGVA